MTAEEKLARYRKNLDSIHAPDDLEERLSRALAGSRRKKRFWVFSKVPVAAVLIVFMLCGYHFNTLAYYGNRLMGYDQIIGQSLQKLNDLGKGQIVDESYTFGSGHTVTLDGIMLDGNQLVAFCTYNSPYGDLEQISLQPDSQLKGTLGRYPLKSGTGISNDESTEMKYVYHFDPPRLWEKTLVMGFSCQSDSGEEFGTIRFVLDRQKAMGFNLRISLQKRFTVGDREIAISSLNASPTRTRIQGTIQGIVELAWDMMQGERFRPQKMDLHLYVNGQEWPLLGGSMTTDHQGINFRVDYDALPKKVQKLELKLVSFLADYDVQEKIDLHTGKMNAVVDMQGKELVVQQVVQNESGTYVTITTPDTLLLTRVYLLSAGKRIALEKTQDETLDKTAAGEILRTRTLYFAGGSDDMSLDIRRIAYETEIGITHTVPLQ